uniref:ABC1 atypical kinase-like domain-containing protein n=1 Tax=Rhizochromulina marina TaxID=1034831 RepID=A0A7S2WUP7_9STRA
MLCGRGGLVLMVGLALPLLSEPFTPGPRLTSFSRPMPSPVLHASPTTALEEEQVEEQGLAQPDTKQRLRDRVPFLRKRSIDKEAEDAAKQLMDASGTKWKDESAYRRTLNKLTNLISKTVKRGTGAADAADDDDATLGEVLEAGWAKRGSGSSIRRNVEVWRFGATAAFQVLKANKVQEPEERKKAATKAAEFIRDGLVRLGPTFVKLGQVISTRTDIFSDAYIQVLKTLQDDVPAFSGKRAKDIVAKELGRPVDEIFDQFDENPIAAASLGQVHSAYYKGSKVAIKVQRAGLKELFDVDLKNLKKLAELLDKFDPKSDGADRDWVAIYDESAKLLYEEIDYLKEEKNSLRFAKDFGGTPWVRTPKVYSFLSTPRLLTMEFVETLKLTDIAQIERLGLDRKLLAKRSAESFLAQVIRTGYFHCDPHPGNLAVDYEGNLVYYDYGMMDELKPNVREGFRNLCFALFEGGPFVSELQISQSSKRFILALEQMGVLAKGADRLAVEKFGRFCIKAFKEVQRGGSPANIKKAIGGDLQALTEAQVFRFPSTFTFIFRAFASIDGIGKGLDKDFDIAKLAQPFIEVFTEEVKYGRNSTEFQKLAAKTSLVTGLNPKDISTAITSPRKIAYIEETVRAMEQGNLKIRVRSLENEKALERMALSQSGTTALLVASVFLNLGLATTASVAATGMYITASAFGAKALSKAVAIKAFDKKLKQFESNDFEET